MATHTDQKLELLKQTPLLAELGRRELEEVGRLVDEIDVAAGKVLMRQGETGREFFVLVDGSVGIDRDGTRVRALGPGDFFGEIALLSEGPRTATATAENPRTNRTICFRSIVASLRLSTARGAAVCPIAIAVTPHGPHPPRTLRAWRFPVLTFKFYVLTF